METEAALPLGWRRVKLGEVIKFSSGQSRPVDTVNAKDSAHSIPVYGGNGVLGWSNKYTTEQPQLVVGRVGAYCGCVHITDETSWITDNALYSAKWLSEVDMHFVADLLAHSDLNKHKRLGGQPLLTQSILQEVELNLPPLPEQQAIAEVLGAVQAALAARRREQQLEQEHKAALLERLFTQGSYSGPTRDTELGPLPLGWEVAELGRLVDIKGGKRLAKGAPFAEEETPYPYLRVTDFLNGTIRTTALKYLTPAVQAKIARYIIRKEDVYISIAGSIGLVGTIPDELDGANLTENAARLVIKNLKQLDRDYLAKFLSTRYGQQQIQGLTTKTTQPKLALARIALIKLPLPPLPEQQRIAAVLGALDAKLEALGTEVARLEELFRALLEELLSGRRRVGGF